MLGQDETLSDVQALLQSRVGTFLQLRAQLQEMQKSPVLTISDKAAQFLVTQGQLETDLPTAVANASSGDVSGIISVSGFVYLMEKQISDVTDLYNEYIGLGSSAKASLFSGIPNWVLYTGGAFILWRILKKRGRK